MFRTKNRVPTVESLLIEKPDNPISFIVEFLQKKYPDQAGVASRSKVPKAQAANGVAGSWELNVDSKSYASDNTSDDDNSDNDSDYMDKDAIFDSRVARDCKRPPIHSEVISEDQDDVIETEKSPGEIAKIISILELLSEFDDLIVSRIGRLGKKSSSDISN